MHQIASLDHLLMAKGQILDGLSYIHEELSLYCGKLDCSTVLLNRDGMVKIGMLIQLNVSIAKAVQRISRSRFLRIDTFQRRKHMRM